MKLLNSFGPNPRAVRMAMIEKGIEMPTEEHDLMAAENRGEAYTKKNPGGQMPSLELDDGTVIAETTAICEYLDEIHPDKPLIGVNPLERANTRQWIRRVELAVTEHMYNGFRYYIAGDKLTFADIVLYCCMDFCKDVGQPLDSDLPNLDAWFKRMDSLPSATASLHPGASEVQMRG